MQQRQCQNIDLVVARHLFFPKMEEGTPEAHHQPPVHSAAPQVGRVLCQIHGAQPLHHAVVGPLGDLRRCHIILPTTGGTGRSGDIPDQVNPSCSLYWNILLLPLQSYFALERRISFQVATLPQEQRGDGSGQGLGCVRSFDYCAVLQGYLPFLPVDLKIQLVPWAAVLFLHITHSGSKSKSLGCSVIHCPIQHLLLPKHNYGSLLPGNGAKLLLHRKFWHSHQFSRELHKTCGNSALNSRWFVFQTAHQRLGQNSQLLAWKRSRRLGKGDVSLGSWQVGESKWCQSLRLKEQHEEQETKNEGERGDRRRE